MLAIRSERESLFTTGVAGNLPLLGAVMLTVLLQMLVIYAPFFNDLFKTRPLSASEFLLTCLLSSSVFFAVELEKWLIRRGWLYREG